jgi:hypothetical protein
MCFSASASFGASGLIGAVAVIAIVKAKTGPQRLFATIPLVFALQQGVEGLLWLSLKEPGLVSWQSVLTYIFLVFATAVWPFFIPFTIWLLEKEKKRKKNLALLTWIGAAVSVIIIFIFYLYPVQVIATHHHLHYRFELPIVIRKLIWLFTILYILATIVAPFISRYKRMKWLGVVFLLSYNFAVIFYDEAVLSVWCYFAAILSAITLWILSELRRDNNVKC